MIDRLNFYDLYAYVIPGFLALFFISIPFAIVGIQLPSLELVILAIILSYFVGHLLQIIARMGITSEITLNGLDRYPSQILMDRSDKDLPEWVKKQLFSDEIRDQLIETIKGDFALDVAPSTHDEQRKIDRRRDDAFRLCRFILLQRTTKSYAEQFQGMYAFHRHSAIACLIGAVFIFGFGFALLSALPELGATASIIMAVLILMGLDLFVKNASFSLSQFIVVIAGYVSGLNVSYAQEAVSTLIPALILVSVVLIVLHVLLVSEYRRFTWIFAKTLLRDYLASKQLPKE